MTNSPPVRPVSGTVSVTDTVSVASPKSASSQADTRGRLARWFTVSDLSQAEKILVAVLAGVPAALAALGTASGDFPTLLANHTDLSVVVASLLVAAAVFLGVGVLSKRAKPVAFALSVVLVFGSVFVGLAAVAITDDHRGTPAFSTLAVSDTGALQAAVRDTGLHDSDLLAVVVVRDHIPVASVESGPDKTGDVVIDLSVPPSPGVDVKNHRYDVEAWIVRSDDTADRGNAGEQTLRLAPRACTGNTLCGTVNYTVPTPSPSPTVK